jgi:hypothetical protein
MSNLSELLFLSSARIFTKNNILLCQLSFIYDTYKRTDQAAPTPAAPGFGPVKAVLP